ncbi:hypothetical protein LZ32DRAFT_611836 [Colletotrichum eremochloae]|nr:hypothetical protein LZ32DRAFT_611836 [Colletotrichum eremochloae]
MHSTYPLLLLLWSLLSCTFSVLGHKGLRYYNDIYTVERYQKDTYRVYTSYYIGSLIPVTTVQFPTESHRLDQIVVVSAWNGNEQAHPDHKPRLHLSDIIKYLASSRHANRRMESVNWIIGLKVVNNQALYIANNYYQAWKKQHPKAKFPAKLTVYPSDSHWRQFQTTSFYKTVGWTFNETEKTVEYIDIVLKDQNLGVMRADMWCRMK